MKFNWATVTGVNPLRITLDGDTEPLPFVPDSLIDPLALAEADRVRTELSGHRLVVLGRAGGNGQGLGVGMPPQHGPGTVDAAAEIYHKDGVLVADAGALDALVPAGVTSMFAGSAAPAGYLLAQGQVVSRTTYAALYAVISTTYGAGDGSTTFNIPDLRGRVPVGLDSTQTEFNVLGEAGGTKTHTLTTDEMPSHKHTTNQTNGYGGGSSRFAVGPGPTSSTNNIDVGASGGGSAHNNLQPYRVFSFIIKY